MNLKIRRYITEDRNMVLTTWKKSYWWQANEKNPPHWTRWVQGLRQWEFWALANLMLNVWVDELDIRCAVLESDHDAIIGWCAVYNGRVAFIYTKPRFRGLGVARKLRNSWPSPPVYGPVSIFERIRAAHEHSKAEEGCSEASGQGR